MQRLTISPNGAITMLFRDGGRGGSRSGSGGGARGGSGGRGGFDRIKKKHRGKRRTVPPAVVLERAKLEAEKAQLKADKAMANAAAATAKLELAQKAADEATASNIRKAIAADLGEKQKLD